MTDIGAFFLPPPPEIAGQGYGGMGVSVCFIAGFVGFGSSPPGGGPGAHGADHGPVYRKRRSSLQRPTISTLQVGQDLRTTTTAQ
jgi:hypothetical protein